MTDNCRDPDIKIGVLTLWISGPADPEDWLHVVAACDAPSATITAAGAILQLSDLRRWLLEIERMNRTLTGEASLTSAEPNLSVSFVMNKLGNISACLEITPDYPSQSHKIIFDLDQSFLPGLITQVKAVVARCGVPLDG